jgi:peptidoglycan/LPS O-acetylase OafA/YrhL
VIKMNRKNNTIDLLRFFASGWVVLFHLNQQTFNTHNSYLSFSALGFLGVPIFFVISGYCIGIASQHSVSSFDFIVKRFFRIFPAYWFSLFVTVFCIGVRIIVHGANDVTVFPRSGGGILATFFILTSPFSKVTTINWVYWSLTIEIFFYLITAFSIIKKGSLFCIVIMVFMALLTFIPGIDDTPGLFFLKHWSPFGMGIALFQMHINRGRNFYFFTGLLILNMTSLFLNHVAFYNIVSIITLGMITISIYIRDLPPNYFSKLGDFSYTVYLIHVPIGVYLICLLKTRFIVERPVLDIFFDVSVLILMNYIAHFIYYWVELPAINYGKSITKNKNYFRLKKFGLMP